MILKSMNFGLGNFLNSIFFSFFFSGVLLVENLWIILAEHYLAEISKNWRQRSSYSELSDQSKCMRDEQLF